MVGSEYITVPLVKISVMAIVEEYLWIELVCPTYILETNHFLHPSIPVHIPRWCIVEYSVFRNVVVKILGAVFCLENYHRWHE